MIDTLTIARRFNGPHDSGNGGYSAGLAAQFLPDAQAVEATIRAPIPLDRELRAHPAGDGIDIMTDDASTRILIMSLQPTHLVVPDVKSPACRRPGSPPTNSAIQTTTSCHTASSAGRTAPPATACASSPTG